MGFSGVGGPNMATNLLEAGDRRVAVAASRGQRSWPIGRWLLISAVLGWFALLILVPTAALLRQVAAGGLRPLLNALSSAEVRHAFGLTVGITVLVTVINAIFGIALALVLVRQRFWGRALVDGMVDLPFAVSPVVAGLMLILLFGPEGWLGHRLNLWGFRVIYAIPGMILATLFVTVPFVVRELVPILRELGAEHEQAAYTLGAGRWRTFWSVTLPSIRWGVAYGVTLTIARSLGEFGAVLVVSGNLVGQTQTATLYIHDGIESFHTEGAYAASFVLAAMSFVLLVGMDAIRKRQDARQGNHP
jgi:sulfate transport system permease protein